MLTYRPYFLSLMLLLYFKILIISQHLSKFATSSYRLQGHEGRSVRFTTCVKDEILNASCKLHTPALVSIALIWQIFEHLNHGIEFPNLATHVSQQITLLSLEKLSSPRSLLYCEFAFLWTLNETGKAFSGPKVMRMFWIESLSSKYKLE